jgi:hypothetical protein
VTIVAGISLLAEHDRTPSLMCCYGPTLVIGAVPDAAACVAVGVAVATSVGVAVAVGVGDGVCVGVAVPTSRTRSLTLAQSDARPSVSTARPHNV